jgi:hypothetical protein
MTSPAAYASWASLTLFTRLFDWRVIGTIRRECLDWMIPVSKVHLRSVLKGDRGISEFAEHSRYKTSRLRTVAGCDSRMAIFVFASYSSIVPPLRLAWARIRAPLDIRLD